MNERQLSFSYKNDAAASYLVVQMDSNSTLEQYQVEMIAHNPSPRILPFVIEQNNGEIYVRYNITSKLSLNQFLHRRKLTKNELLFILREIAETILGSKNYFLWEESFLLSKDYIYINPESLKVSMVYIPIVSEQNISEAFRNFVITLIANTVKLEDAGGDNYVIKILNYLKDQTFNIVEFRKLISEIYIGKDIDELQTQHKELVQKKIPDSITKNESANKNSKMKYPSTTLKIVGLIQVLFCIMILLIFINMHPFDVITFIGAILFTGALDFIISRKLLDKKNLIEVVEKKKKNEILIADNMQNDDVIYDTKDTVFLGKTKSNHPYLKCIKEGMIEKIIIDRKNFIIGRLEEQVDYVSNNKTVGRVHAELISREGMYYIKDLNSRNGTFLNGTRINSNIEYKLKAKDRIAIADCEYIFAID